MPPVPRPPPEPLDGSQIALYCALAFFLLVVFAGVIAWFRGLKRTQDADDEAKRERAAQAHLEDVQAKVLLSNGRRACVVCHAAQATEAWPVVERSWLDKVTALKDLYALTPRYSVRDGWGDEHEYQLCAADKRVVKQKWEEMLAAKRTQVQQLFSNIESELAQMQGGMMLLWARTQHARAAERLQDVLGALPPQLPAAQVVAVVERQADGPISMPPMSTKGTSDVEVIGSYQGGSGGRGPGDE